MPKFLDERALGQEIQKLLKGRDLRCAVAFWGNGAKKKLFKNGKLDPEAKIVCDWTMGGTNPTELEALGAPKNKNLKHVPGLHAKLYISDFGVIACSANASNNGIGFLDAPKLVEVGMLHEARTEVYSDAVKWFDHIWSNADIIDDRVLKNAKKAWKSRVTGKKSPKAQGSGNPVSLLDVVISDPERFKGVGFAFTTGNSNVAARDDAVEVIRKRTPNLSKDEREALPKWPISNVYSGWSKDDISRWPYKFVSIHWGHRAKRPSYWFYERAYIAYEQGALLARSAKGLKRELGLGVSYSKMAAADTEVLRPIFQRVEECEHFLFANGEELVDFLERNRA